MSKINTSRYPYKGSSWVYGSWFGASGLDAVGFVATIDCILFGYFVWVYEQVQKKSDRNGQFYTSLEKF